LHLKILRTAVGIPMLIVGLTSSGCAPPGGDGRIQPEYDPTTGRLHLLKYDANADGTIDTWSYMDFARVVRIEVDSDRDAEIDRWEYYRPDQTIEKIGISRAGANTPDSWAFYDAAGTMTRLELSMRRDGKPVRVEHYQNGVRVRAEEDTNGDDHVDKWEVYEGARLASVALDTQRRGTPDRRVIYAQDGSARLEQLP
jgi:hypothetical protein